MADKNTTDKMVHGTDAWVAAVREGIMADYPDYSESDLQEALLIELEEDPAAQGMDEDEYAAYEASLTPEQRAERTKNYEMLDELR